MPGGIFQMLQIYALKAKQGDQRAFFLQREFRPTPFTVSNEARTSGVHLRCRVNSYSFLTCISKCPLNLPDCACRLGLPLKPAHAALCSPSGPSRVYPRLLWL
eukprot:1176754-Prorocentrum_minimum.AAC.3